MAVSGQAIGQEPPETQNFPLDFLPGSSILLSIARLEMGTSAHIIGRSTMPQHRGSVPAVLRPSLISLVILLILSLQLLGLLILS